MYMRNRLLCIPATIVNYSETIFCQVQLSCDFCNSKLNSAQMCCVIFRKGKYARKMFF